MKGRKKAQEAQKKRSGFPELLRLLRLFVAKSC
jgi:hypothetical protein